MSDQTAAPESVSTPITPESAKSDFAAARETLTAADTWRLSLDPAPAEVQISETVATPDAGSVTEFSQDESGKWHREDGTFATVEETADLNAQVAAPAETPASDAPPEAIVVTLRARDGSDVELEVTDPKLAELIRANHNDGMRREEFTRRMETVEAKEAELREFETLLRTNPESVILQRLPEDKQVAIATALVAQHWDKVYQNLVNFEQDPTARVTQAMRSQIAIRDQQAEFTRAVEHQRYVARVENAVASAVPETIADDVRDRFLADAANDIAREIQRTGTPVPVESIASLIAPRLALYGFGADRPTSTTPVATPSRPVARPVVRSQAATPAPQANAGATVRRTVTAQRIAAAIAPQGAGAATVNVPLIPKDADVLAAGRAMRTQKSWGTAA